MFYATTRKKVPQILSDAGLVLWCVLWGYLASKVRQLILLFAVPAQEAQGSASSLASSMDSAASSMEGVPVLGTVLSPPLNAFSSGLGSLVVTLQHYVRFVDVTSIVVATIVAVVPIAYYLWKWLPWRFSFVREATAGKKLLPADASAELFALRAMAHAPMRDLARITDDPMGAWKSGDEDVIRKLADLELRQDGLRLPKKASLL